MGRNRHKKVKGRDVYRRTIDLPRGPRNERRRRAMFGKTVAELDRKESELRQEIATGMVLEPSRVTVRQYLDNWLQKVSGNIEPSTQSSYRSAIRAHIVPAIGSVRVTKLSAMHIHRALDAVPGASTRKHVWVVLNQAATMAVKWNLLARNPCEQVNPPRVPHKEMLCLDRDQAERFLRAAEAERLHAMYVLAATRGVRQGELYGLTPKDVDLKGKRLSIVRTVKEANGKLTTGPPKTRSSRRTVILPQLCIDALHEHQKRRMAEGVAKAAWLFCDAKGGLLRRQNVQRRSFKPLLVRAELPSIRFHDLRHTAATLALLAGDNPKVVSEMLGHARVGITLDLYGHVLPTMQEESADRVDQMFGVG